MGLRRLGFPCFDARFLAGFGPVYHTEWSYARIAKVARSCGVHVARGVIAGWDVLGRM